MDLPLRTRLAASAGRAIAQLSRRARAGSGSTIGGRVTLALDADALTRMAAGREVVLVSGTNGKTTTTRLVAAALATHGPVATSAEGANLLPGLVTALATDEGADAPQAALEVDEGVLAAAAAATHPVVMVLLNLSRDQLDRIGEVRLHAQSWRRTIERLPGCQVVANVDDPLVVWAAGTARLVSWVGTGQTWRHDAATCPACGGRITWGSGGATGGAPWACTTCDLARPEPALWVDRDALVTASGETVPLALLLPGRINRANAAMAGAAARALGVGLDEAAAAMATVGTVAGRYEVLPVGAARVRLLLAKNPAGWAETLDLLAPPPRPVVVGINAHTADGYDPSWLWDVPFERLAGRPVVATGERGRDLAVRLRYADVPHTWVPTWAEAVSTAVGGSAGGARSAPEVDLAANYTAFQDARRALARHPGTG